MPPDAEALVAESIHPHLMRQLHEHIEAAATLSARRLDWLAPSSQSRQALGLVRRSAFFTSVGEPVREFGGEFITVTPTLQAIPVHDEVVSIDLLRVGRIYLWVTRVRACNTFAVLPSATVKRFASTLECFRPLFNDPLGPILLPLFYELDESQHHVVRVGIGMPSRAFTAVEQEIIGNALLYAAQYDLRVAAAAEAANGEHRRHRLGFRGFEETQGDTGQPSSNEDDHTN